MRTPRALAMTSSALALLGMAGAGQHQPAFPADRPPPASATAPNEKIVKVGRDPEVTFSKGVNVGGTILAPARYRIQHRVDGADHIVRFQPLAMTPKGFSFPAGDGIEIKCRLEPLQSAAKATTLWIVHEETGQRLTRLQIRGEGVAHVF